MFLSLSVHVHLPSEAEAQGHREGPGQPRGLRGADQVRPPHLGLERGERASVLAAGRPAEALPHRHGDETGLSRQVTN